MLWLHAKHVNSHRRDRNVKSKGPLLSKSVTATPTLSAPPPPHVQKEEEEELDNLLMAWSGREQTQVAEVKDAKDDTKQSMSTKNSRKAKLKELQRSKVWCSF